MEAVPGQPLVRPLEDRDAIRHGEPVADAAAGQRAALIEPQQIGARGLLFDDEGDIVQPAAKAGRNRFHGLLHQRVELARRHLNTIMAKRIVVAIDGPAGSGKSTIARRLAAKLGFLYIDSGAMYRAVGLWALRANIDPEDAHRLGQLAREARIELEPGGARVLLNGEDVSEAIRTPEVSQAASKVSAVPGVRRAMVEEQRRMAAQSSVVMEGRDIGTVVFPHAEIKIFLDADSAVRAPASFRGGRRKRRDHRPPRDGAPDRRTRPARPHPLRGPARASARRDLCGLHGSLHRPGRRGCLETHPRSHLQRKGVNELKDLLVMKFGGTSMGSAERIRIAAGIAAAERRTRPVLVVVSAMSKVTDLLLDTLHHAEAGDQAGMESCLQKLRERHVQTCQELLPRREAGGMRSMAFTP